MAFCALKIPDQPRETVFHRSKISKSNQGDHR